MSNVSSSDLALSFSVIKPLVTILGHGPKEVWPPGRREVVNHADGSASLIEQRSGVSIDAGALLGSRTDKGAERS